MLDIALLTTVLAVVREGSFERAARVLHISPSAVSQRIRLIEERMGAVLIVRGQPCIPTEIGARICRHAEMMTMLEADLHRGLPQLVPDGRHRESLTMRIAINADSLSTWFIDALQEFCKEEGPLIDVTIDDQDKTGDWLRRGHVLAAVTSLAKPIQGCRSRKLGALRYCATAAPEFIRRWFGAGVTVDALSMAPSLVFDRNDRLQERWVRRVVRKDIALAAYRLPSSQAFVDAALAGIGWGMNPVVSVQEHLNSGRLQELAPHHQMDVPLYWQVNRMPLPALDRLTRSVMLAASKALTPSQAMP